MRLQSASSYSACSPRPPTDKLGAAQAAGLFTSPLAASAIASSYDYDSDGKTSLGELTRDMTGQGVLAVPDH